MPALADLQRQFLAALTHGDDEKISAAIVDRAPGIDKVLAVYRNNWRSNLRSALRATFPVVERLVGAEYFDWMADRFIDVQPSQSGNLDNYGAEFPGFIRHFAGVAELTYLADVAELEFHIDAVLIAPDETPSSLFASPFPVHRIWQVNQEGWQGDETVSLDEGAAYLLIQRRAVSSDAARHYDLFIQPLTADQFHNLNSRLHSHTNKQQG